MQSGLAISLGGHGALILAALIGWPFARAPEPAAPQSVSVSLVSPEQLESAPPPAAPRPQDSLAALPPPPAPEAAPRPADRPAQQPQSAAPPPPPPPVDRVAPVPQPAPPEQTRPAEMPSPAVTPVPAPEAAPQEPREAAAPEAAAPEIVTEATETDDTQTLAPETVPRPVRKQDRPPAPVDSADLTPDAEAETGPEPLAEAPDPDPTPEPEPVPAETATEDAVAAALAEALSQPDAPPAPVPAPSAPPVPAGPPLSASDREGLRVAVGQCWNFGALSTDAARVTVVVSLSMAADGRPMAESLRLASWSGGDEAAANQAYEAARRAILRCQPYTLPAEKYDQWREIEMTFNPERMRQK